MPTTAGPGAGLLAVRPCERMPVFLFVTERATASQTPTFRARHDNNRHNSISGGSIKTTARTTSTKKRKRMSATSTTTPQPGCTSTTAACKWRYVPGGRRAIAIASVSRMVFDVDSVA